MVYIHEELVQKSCCSDVTLCTILREAPQAGQGAKTSRFALQMLCSLLEVKTSQQCYMSCSRRLNIRQALHCWAWPPELGTAQLETARQPCSAGELQPWPEEKLEPGSAQEL